MNKHGIIKQLENLGSEQTKKILINHGAKEPVYGVKISDLKKIAKPIRKNNDIAIELYNTGIYDAMYLSGIIINTKELKKETLIDFMDKVDCYTISESTVPSMTAETKYAVELSKLWINSEEELKEAGGWSTYSNYISITNDDLLDIDEIKQLLNYIKEEIHNKPNRVKYAMNGFAICVGAYIKELADYSLLVSDEIGKVNVDMGDTSCKVASARDSIEKIVNMNRCGLKRKSCRC